MNLINYFTKDIKIITKAQFEEYFDKSFHLDLEFLYPLPLQDQNIQNLRDLSLLVFQPN